MSIFTRAHRSARQAANQEGPRGIRPVVVLSGPGTVIEYRARNRPGTVRAIKHGPQQWLVITGHGHGLHRHEADIIDDIDPSHPVRELLHGIAA